MSIKLINWRGLEELKKSKEWDDVRPLRAYRKRVKAHIGEIGELNGTRIIVSSDSVLPEYMDANG